MITDTTKTVLAILGDIAYNKTSSQNQQYPLVGQTLPELLDKLETYGLIRRLAEQPRGVVVSYTLTHPSTETTLLQVLEATGEHLNCNNEVQEQMYEHYSIAARKLGVINEVTRKLLSEIKLIDLL